MHTLRFVGRFVRPAISIRVESEQPNLIELLKPAEVAARLGVSRTWLYDAARDGRIPSVRIGGREGPLRFVPEDLQQWLDDARAQWTPGQRHGATRGTARDHLDGLSKPQRTSRRARR
jgi:excisionase family DNA binding protein